MFAAQAERAGVDLVTVSGTHFFVQEDSERAAALVREHLAW
jgi:surfactin synthase thioesterase subunit